jgi:type II secretory pathway pseudopilin PulG
VKKGEQMQLNRRRGYSLMELIVGFMLVAIGLALFVPSGRGTKDIATSRAAAEELVARLRAARQTAITKGVPVAVAFPRTPSIFHTDEAFQLEGETSPQVTERWKIQQPDPRVVYFTGQWMGPTWDVAPVLTTAYSEFDPEPSVWFGPVTPPEATMFVFTPAGNAVSTEEAADGRFRVVVGMGIDTGATLSAVNAPFTIWIDPSGEIGFDPGLHNGAAVAATKKIESYPVASFSGGGPVTNVPPTLLPIPPSTGAMSYPNNRNPKTNNGNVVDLNSVLTLEVRVADANGDPPYFQWKATEVGEVNANGTAWAPQTNMMEWGGRFGNQTQVRMEWDAETREWVGRDTWTPSTRDKGGNRYVLECDITDRKSPPIQARFPVVPGTFLVTTKEPWVLYKTQNAAGMVELWKMTLDGLLHTPLVQFGYQNVDFGQWSPSGHEIVVGAADGVYRVTANGENLTKVSSVVLPGGIDGCCISPQGDAVYYLGGNTEAKKIRKVFLDGSGTQADVTLDPLDPGGDGGDIFGGTGNNHSTIDEVYDLTSAYFGPAPGKVVLMHTMYQHKRDSTRIFGRWRSRTKIRYGAMAIDAATGARTDWIRHTDNTGSRRDPDPHDSNDLGFGQVGTTNYGVSLFRTDIDLGGGNMETHVLYGDAAGNINIRVVDFNGGMNIQDFRANTFKRPPIATGIADTHHPKYGHPDRSSLIFAAGRNAASRIYYMPNIDNPGEIREVPLHPANIGAEAPSVSRPR